MIPEIISKWDQNKGSLEKYFKTTPQSEYWNYIDILKKIFELVINDYQMSFESDNITVIDRRGMDRSEYQGTLMFITPQNIYQPSATEYLLTDVWYGSCECSNVIEIIRYDHDPDNLDGYSGIPNASQLRKYMMLSLHLIQRMRWLPGSDVTSFEYTYYDFDRYENKN